MCYKNIILSIGIVIAFQNIASAQDLVIPQQIMDVRTIEEKYPEIFSNYKPNHPDTAYEIGKQIPGFVKDFSGNEGKSQFYLLYAQHLQNINTNDFAKQYRTKFLALYQSINRVNELVDNKLGYYTQMQTMLIAYAEYSLHEFNLMEQSKFETIDVQKQKKFFIKSIQQKVKTKNQQLNLVSNPNFNKNQEIIGAEIKRIESLITDAYTLKVSQVFHYKYY